MPIKGLTESRRLPRLGKIHLGIKKQSAKSGNWYPSATDYFVIPPEIAGVVGEKPTELPILFPVEDEEKFASQYYRSYSMTRGLVCRGDGETCRRMVDATTGEMANRDSTDILWKDELPCAGQDCQYYGKQCKEVMNLQFLLPTVEGLGIWQIDTSSINSIKNINSTVELIRGVFGRIAMIPLTLTLEPIEVVNPDDGKKKRVRVLNLRIKGTMIELLQRTLKPTPEMLLPAPIDTEAPEDMEPVAELELPAPDEGPAPTLITPQTQEPKPEEKGISQRSLTPITKDEKQATKEPKLVPPAEQEPLWPEDSNIDIEWLKESFETLRARHERTWEEENLLGYMKTTYKVKADTVLAGAVELDKGQAAHLVKAIQDALDRSSES